MGRGKKFFLDGEVSETLEELRRKSYLKHAHDRFVFCESAVEKNLDSVTYPFFEEECGSGFKRSRNKAISLTIF